MFCCKNCFASNYLNNIIEGYGQTGICDFCGTRNTPVVFPRMLFPQFQNILNSFTPDMNSKETLIPLLEKYFPCQIFSDNIKDNKEKILKAIVSDEYDTYKPLFGGPVAFIYDDSGGIQLTWENFKKEIKNVNRFHIQNGLNLRELEDQFSKRELSRTLKKGAVVYRGRISGKEGFKRKDMSNPPENHARAGRANPAGISYLYVADQPKTTLYETRASLLDYVTIGKFEVLEDLKVMNLRDNTSLDLIRWAESEEVEMFLFIYKLQEELSKPYRNTDQELDYIPTQYLCEFIKSLGYDGVEYQSSLYPPGYNIAVFKPTKLKCKSVSIHEIEKIDFKDKKLLKGSRSNSLNTRMGRKLNGEEK